jgi:lysosomal alpha-mannosidase
MIKNNLFPGKVENFANHVQRYASAYKTNNIMMTMGGDFSYSVASSWFRNMDKLIKYRNFLFLLTNNFL